MANKYLPIQDLVIHEYVEKVRRQIGGRLKSLYLFGSRARGDAWEGSDYNIALVVNDRDRKLEEVVLDVSTFLLDQFDVLISTQIFSEQEWAIESKLPLGRNIIKEGIVL